MEALQIKKFPVFFLVGLGIGYGVYKSLFLKDGDGIITIAASVAMLSAMHLEERKVNGKLPVSYKVLAYAGIALSSALISFVVVNDILN